MLQGVAFADEILSAEAALRRREFARAARHTRLVHFLRRAIPIGCALAVCLPIAWTFLNPFSRMKVDIDVGGMHLSGSKITMEAPKLTGYKKDNRAYVVNARSAAQDPRKPNIVELTDIAADIEMPNNGKATLKSAFGVYDTQTEKLDLQRAIELTTQSGYDIRTANAVIEFKGGRVLAPNPVSVKMNGGTIDADRMEILNSGEEIIFEGHVVSEFTNNRGSQAGEQPGAQAKP